MLIKASIPMQTIHAVRGAFVNGLTFFFELPLDQNELKLELELAKLLHYGRYYA
jgi:hypothetical protein